MFLKTIWRHWKVLQLVPKLILTFTFKMFTYISIITSLHKSFGWNPKCIMFRLSKAPTFEKNVHSDISRELYMQNANIYLLVKKIHAKILNLERLNFAQILARKNISKWQPLKVERKFIIATLKVHKIWHTQTKPIFCTTIVWFVLIKIQIPRF